MANPAARQQGQGANAGAGDAMNLLRTGSLTRAPGEVHQLGRDVPATFPSDLIPGGADVAAVSTAPSMTVVVSPIKAGASFNRFRYVWALEDKGVDQPDAASGRLHAHLGGWRIDDGLPRE